MGGIFPLFPAKIGLRTGDVFTLRPVARSCGPVGPVVLLTLLEVGGLDHESQPLGVSGSGLASPW